MPSLLATRPGRSNADLSAEVRGVLRTDPNIPEEILPDVLVRAYQNSSTLDEVLSNLAEFGGRYSARLDPVNTYRLAEELDGQIESGRWQPEEREALLAELERQFQMALVAGESPEQARRHAFARLTEKLKGERISPSIVVTDGKVRVGGIWLPVRS